MPTNPTILPYLDKPIEGDFRFIIFAAPLDKTTSYRSGTRFGPNAVRRESHFLDTYSVRTGFDWDDLEISDIGDIDCSSIDICLSGIEDTIKSINGFPVMLGGEHTITLGAIRALKPELVVVFDAHLDVRDELFGERLCHATYLRRAIEEIGCRTLVIGARALSGEEVAYADESESVYYVTSRDFIDDPDGCLERISRDIESFDSVYLSIDLDVLDPAFAPAVGNPHPEGLTTSMLLDAIDIVMKSNVIGFDLNEIYPHFDQGITATTAAYLVMESLYSYLGHRHG